jgi:hypothetical protein
LELGLGVLGLKEGGLVTDKPSWTLEGAGIGETRAARNSASRLNLPNHRKCENNGN